MCLSSCSIKLNQGPKPAPLTQTYLVLDSATKQPIHGIFVEVEVTAKSGALGRGGIYTIGDTTNIDGKWTTTYNENSTLGNFTLSKYPKFYGNYIAFSYNSITTIYINP